MSLLIGAERTPECPNPSLPRGSNVKHRTTQCAKLSAIVTTNTTSSIRPEGTSISNHIVTSSLSLEGTNKITIATSSASVEGTNDNQLHIVTSSLNPEGTNEITIVTSFVSLEGTNDVSRSCKHQHSLSTRETLSTILSIS